MINKTIQHISTMISGAITKNEININANINGVCIDSRRYKQGNIFFALVGENVDSHKYISNLEAEGCSLFIISNIEFAPKKSAFILVEDTIISLQELAKNYRTSLNTKIIGITGSNGKTSCKDMLAAALSSTFKTQKTMGNKNNEIGVPLTILSLSEDCEVAVVEMAMEKEGDIAFLNNIVNQNHAIVTNVGDAHLLFMKNKENIATEKLHIMDNLNSESLFAYYGDDDILKEVMEYKVINTAVNIKTYGSSFNNDIYIKRVSQNETGIRFTTNKSDYEFHIAILGKHQAINALSVIHMCYKLNLTDDQIQAGLNNIEVTSMRNEVQHINQCCILNDSYKSNPQSALAALDTFELFESNYKIAILADMLELGTCTEQIHYSFGEDLVKYQLDEIICVGELSKYIKSGYETKLGVAKLMHMNNNEEVYEYLKENVFKSCMLLFKGSRGMALDTVINKLKEYGNNV